MKKSSLTIEYCPKCHWLLRAAYMAQEFLTTFESDLKEVTLQPSEVNGSYRISGYYYKPGRQLILISFVQTVLFED